MALLGPASFHLSRYSPFPIDAAAAADHLRYIRETMEAVPPNLPPSPGLGAAWAMGVTALGGRRISLPVNLRRKRWLSIWLIEVFCGRGPIARSCIRHQSSTVPNAKLLFRAGAANSF